eukprot:scaffold74371_cov69-Phaeocystis_antarctica.AAC.4
MAVKRVRKGARVQSLFEPNTGEGRYGGQGLTLQENAVVGQPLVSPFLNGAGASAAAQLNSISLTDVACLLRGVGEDPSQLPASGARHTPFYPATVLIYVAHIPVSLRRACGAAAEGCVTITVHSSRLPGTVINSEQDARRQMLRRVKQGFDLVTPGRQQPQPPARSIRQCPLPRPPCPPRTLPLLRLRRNASTESSPPITLAAEVGCSPEAAEHKRPDEHCKRQDPRQPRLRAKAVGHAVVHDACESADAGDRAHLQLLDAPDEHKLLVEAPRVAVAMLADVRARPLGDDCDERSRRRLALDIHQSLCRASRLEHLLVGHHALEHRLAALHAELAP